MSWRLLPEGVTPAARTLLWGRGLRAFADGFVSLLLPAYLTLLGFSPFQVGVLLLLLGLGVELGEEPSSRRPRVIRDRRTVVSVPFVEQRFQSSDFREDFSHPRSVTAQEPPP